MSTIFYDSTAYVRVGDDLLFSGGQSFTQGQSFTTPAGTWNFNSLKLTLRRPAGAANGQVTVDLWADNGAAVPVTLIQNLVTAFVIVYPDANPHTFTITIPTIVLGGLTRYWIFCKDLNNTGTAWQTAGVHADGEFNAGMDANLYVPTSDAVNGPTMMQVAGDPTGGFTSPFLGPGGPIPRNVINFPWKCCPRPNPRCLIRYKTPVMKRGNY
jgi:hypothetical protein